jgi:Mce-associated membrane protein
MTDEMTPLTDTHGNDIAMNAPEDPTDGTTATPVEDVGGESDDAASSVGTGPHTKESQDPHSDGDEIGSLPRRRGLGILGSQWFAAAVIVVALAVLTGWLGYGTYQSHQDAERRAEFLEVGRQAAVNLTTLDFNDADAGVHRILDSATGKFRDEFASRSQPFIDALKQARSSSRGTVTIAGLESVIGAEAKVLVAVSVQSSTEAVPEQNPRAWRMQITIQQENDGMKVSNVEFVP